MIEEFIDLMLSLGNHVGEFGNEFGNFIVDLLLM